MRFSHNHVLCPLSVLGCILASMASLEHTSHQASAAPIRTSVMQTPPSSSTTAPQPDNSLRHFPYPVTGSAPSSLYRPGQVLDSCTTPNSYAISFDDGPGQLTDELLDFLDEQRVKVTFFMNGDNWDCIYRPESQRLLRRAFQSQHQIAAHPWSHRDFEIQTDDEIREEMQKVEHAFRQILGVVPRYMRPPYGEHSKRVRKIMEEMGYLMILWDVDQLEENDRRLGGASSQQSVDCEISLDDNDEYENERREQEEDMDNVDSQIVMSSHKHQTQDVFSSKWAEAVRGVPHVALDRDTMMVGGIYQEATSVWAVEYVQNLGYDIMTVGACMGEVDPRLWYKEISEPADESTLPKSCYF